MDCWRLEFCIRIWRVLSLKNSPNFSHGEQVLAVMRRQDRRRPALLAK
jgi:hypothetical protein